MKCKSKKYLNFTKNVLPSSGQNITYKLLPSFLFKFIKSEVRRILVNSY